MTSSNNWPPLRDRKGVSLPDAVKAEFGKGCPCCARRHLLWRYRVRRGQRTPTNAATHAHDFSVARGGDPRQWFFACSQCNNDQGALDLVTWTRKLVYDDDPRAQHVERLSAFVRGWVAALEEEDAA